MTTKTLKAVTLIATLTNTVVRGGKLVTDKAFIVTDEAGNLLGGKQYPTEAEAKEAQGELQHIADGMAFVVATTPDLSPKAKVGKAKIVAAYLKWVEDGKPVTEEGLGEEEDETAPEEAVESEEVESDEDF